VAAHHWVKHYATAMRGHVGGSLGDTCQRRGGQSPRLVGARERVWSGQQARWQLGVGCRPLEQIASRACVLRGSRPSRGQVAAAGWLPKVGSLVWPRFISLALIFALYAWFSSGSDP
jgi:hypothetical protein